MCILGEPTENKVVLAHFGSLWLRLSTSGPFIHTAFSEGRRDENSIVRMRPVLDAVLEWLPEWEERMSHGGVRGVANVGGIEGGFGWRASRTPHRTDLFLDLRVPPSVSMADARREALEFARSLDGVEAEVYVTAPGAEIEESHALVAALDEAHADVFGARPERDVVRWFSDASVLSRYGIATVNYGTSSGLPDAELGENLSVDGLVDTARVYALRGGARLRGRMTHDVYTLPPNLPAPVDDGASDHLPGLKLSPLVLDSSGGRVDLAELASSWLVLYVYPRDRTSRSSDAAGLGRHSRRARLHAAVMRVPRPLRGASGARSRGGGAECPATRRPGRVRGAEPHPVPRDRAIPTASSARRCACRRSKSKGRRSTGG